MHPARPVRWKSVSTLQELDAAGLRFSYRTVNADGNPSYTLWSWKLTPTPLGVQVSVHWDVYLESLDRRLFAGPKEGNRSPARATEGSFGRGGDTYRGRSGEGCQPGSHSSSAQHRTGPHSSRRGKMARIYRQSSHPDEQSYYLAQHGMGLGSCPRSPQHLNQTPNTFGLRCL